MIDERWWCDDVSIASLCDTPIAWNEWGSTIKLMCDVIDRGLCKFHACQSLKIKSMLLSTEFKIVFNQLMICAKSFISIKVYEPYSPPASSTAATEPQQNHHGNEPASPNGITQADELEAKGIISSANEVSL